MQLADVLQRILNYDPHTSGNFSQFFEGTQAPQLLLEHREFLEEHFDIKIKKVPSGQLEVSHQDWKRYLHPL